MTAPEILEAVIADLGEWLDLATSEPGYERDPFLEALHKRVRDAETEWTRAKLSSMRTNG